MKKLAVIFCISTVSILILNTLSSCEKNQEDQQLKDQLLGTWKSTNSYYKSYTFYEDNTFIDTSFVLNDQSTLVPLDIISGKYFIKDAQLSFSDIALKYSQSINQYTDGYYFTYDPVYDIKVEGDNLTINQKDIFESISNSNSGILGKWRHDKLFAIYNTLLENKYSGGKLDGIYEFKSDLSVIWLFDSSFDKNIVIPGSSMATYELTDSQLSINQWSIYNITAAFTKNRMIWTYRDRTFVRK